MRTDLDHLPPQKQRELERVVQLIFEEFDDAFALAKHEWKKAGRILIQIELAPRSLDPRKSLSVRRERMAKFSAFAIVGRRS